MLLRIKLSTLLLLAVVVLVGCPHNPPTPPPPPPPPTLQIVTQGVLPGAEVGLPYTAVFAALGGVPPYTWSAPNGTPPGLRLTAAGTLTGTPAQPGVFSFVIQVTDSAKASVRAPVDVNTIAGEIHPEPTNDWDGAHLLLVAAGKSKAKAAAAGTCIGKDGKPLTDARGAPITGCRAVAAPRLKKYLPALASKPRVTGTAKAARATAGLCTNAQGQPLRDANGVPITGCGGGEVQGGLIITIQGAAPVVSGISPNSGPTTGGTSVLIAGTGFRPGAIAALALNACTSIIVVNPNTITCNTPPGAQGAADVTVTNVDNTSGTLPGGYTYQGGGGGGGGGGTTAAPAAYSVMIDGGAPGVAWSYGSGPTSVPACDTTGGITNNTGSTTDPNSQACFQNQFELLMCYLNQNHFGSQAYLKWNTAGSSWVTPTDPVVYYFPKENGNPTYWAALHSNLATWDTNLSGNCPAGLGAGLSNGTPQLIDENAGGFTTAGYNGGFGWPQPLAYTATDQLLWNGSGGNYLDNFYSTAQANPTKLATGGLWKGFDDNNASWGSNRIIAQQCGQAWMNTWAKVAASGYSSSTQLAAVGIGTWNDYEEGTEIETGIDPCYRIVTPTITGATISWTATTNDSTYAPLSSGVPSNTTVQYWQVLACSTSDTNCQVLADNIPLRTFSADLSTLAAGSYHIYVRLVGAPDIWNVTSAVVNYTVATPPPPPPPPSGSPVYPLKAAAGGRYLVGSNGSAFMLVGDSPQCMLPKVSEADARTYFANRAGYGVNSAWVNIMGCSAPATVLQTYDGIPAFTSGSSVSNYDISKPNPQYFQRLLDMVSIANTYNIVVFLDLDSYSSISMLVNNGATKSKAFGAYLGNLFKNVPNVVWMTGNDQNQSNVTQNTILAAYMSGIQSADPNHLQTVEVLPNPDYGLNDSYLSPYITLNPAYSYSPLYDIILKAYNHSTMPVYLEESNYEGGDICTVAAGGPATTLEAIRAQLYWTMTSGATGYMTSNDQWITFFTSGWQSNLNTPGYKQLQYWKQFFNSLSWNTLVPDQASALVTSGRGTYVATALLAGNSNCALMFTNDYVTAGLTSDSKTAVLFFPQGGTVAVNMGKFSESSVQARWFDPTNGTYTTATGSPFVNTGSHSFTTPGNNAAGAPDWVLLLSQAGSTNSYTTTFPNTENPLSEGGNWVDGHTVGLDWADVQSGSGNAWGQEGSQTTASYSDAIAFLTGSWGISQTAQATVFTSAGVPNVGTPCYPEIELHLHSSLSAHSATGYEITWAVDQSGTSSAAYFILVRWNGARGNFTILKSLTGATYGVKNGDVVKAVISGSIISAYKNGNLVATVSDSTYASGTPGIGFNGPTGGVCQAGALDNTYGFSQFSAHD